jgi:hypothetical protein
MLYCGLDVSLRQTALCIVDGDGRVLREAKLASDPELISRFLCENELRCERIGIEAGGTSTWLCMELRRLGHPAICIAPWRVPRGTGMARERSYVWSHFGERPLMRSLQATLTNPILCRLATPSTERKLLPPGTPTTTGQNHELRQERIAMTQNCLDLQRRDREDNARAGFRLLVACY